MSAGSAVPGIDANDRVRDLYGVHVTGAEARITQEALTQRFGQEHRCPTQLGPELIGETEEILGALLRQLEQVSKGNSPNQPPGYVSRRTSPGRDWPGDIRPAV